MFIRPVLQHSFIPLSSEVQFTLPLTLSCVLLIADRYIICAERVEAKRVCLRATACGRVSWIIMDVRSASLHIRPYQWYTKTVVYYQPAYGNWNMIRWLLRQMKEAEVLISRSVFQFGFDEEMGELSVHRRIRNWQQSTNSFRRVAGLIWI